MSDSSTKKVILFSPEQKAKILEYLQFQDSVGYTLEDVIELLAAEEYVIEK